MKRILKKILLGIGIIPISYFFYSHSFCIQHDVSDLVLENIEALALNESVDNHLCIGIGAIDCDGRKVIYMY